MNRIRELFKSNKFILLFSMTLTLIMVILDNAIGTGDLYLELVILPALSLLLGPFAILGFVIMEGLLLIISYPDNIPYILTIVIILFIGNMMLWKLWYSVMNKNGYEIPNLNTVYNVIKLFAIYWVHLLMLWVLFYGVANESEVTDYFINSIIILPSFCILVILFGIHICTKYKIRPYAPKKQLKRFLPEKTYSIILIITIIAIIIGFVNALTVNNLDYSQILAVLILLLSIVYLTKPLNDDYSINDDMDLNLLNKINYSLIIILIIIVPLLSLPLTLIYMEHFSVFKVIEDLSYVSIQFFTLILIPVLVYLYYLEKNMINPINRLSKSLSRTINNEEDYQNLINDLNSMDVNNELNSLANSLLEMENDLRIYGKQLAEVTAQKERFETELKLAHEIQNSMIPKNFEEYNDGDDCEIWGLMKPAREVAGDFYDYFKIDNDNIGFVIGDVSGKGISAALIMDKTMTLIQDYAKHYDDLSEVFHEVNNHLCEGNVENLFVTCWLGKINFRTKKLSYVNAGHNPPLIRRNENFEYMNMEPEIVLATMEDFTYETCELQLKSGDAIILYTDGITEANFDYNEFYGEERLKDIVNKHKDDTLENIINSVEKDMMDFCEKQEQFDDTTMFAIRLK